MTITHSERFASVIPTGTGLEVSSYYLNPGLSSICPWLASVANRFEKYKFRSCEFRYVPQAAANAGTVTMAFDFDPADDPPVTQEQACQFHDYVTTSIWAGAALRIDLANGDKLPQKLTRPGLPGGDIDLSTYDVGRLHVLTIGAAAGTVGYLEVTYVVDLFVHQVQAGVGGGVTGSGTLDATHLVGATFTADNESFLPVAKTSTSVMTATQPFEGVISFMIVGTGLTANFAPVVSATGAGAAVHQIVNAATDTVEGWCRVRLNTGTTLTPTITCTTVTSVTYVFSSATYESII
jgi:hypothetical protein